ncbi:MAG TPA: hypothetical protein VFB44_10885 [Thermoleophilaceae bacterium]|nr:hypothetical protein [Thermoleophilaceae bacterium]
MTAVVKDAVTKRLSGDRPSAFKAALVASAVGLGVAVLAYRVLRS